MRFDFKKIKRRVALYGIYKAVLHYLPWRIVKRINKQYHLNKYIEYREDNRTNDDIQVLTFVWGTKYLTWFFKYTLPALMQAGNLPRLLDEKYFIKYKIYTSNKHDFDSCAKKYNCSQFFQTYSFFEIIEFSESMLQDESIKANILLEHIKNCHEKSAISFLVPSDTIFGNNSVYNACKLLKNKNVAIAFPPIRISATKIKNTSFQNWSTHDKLENNSLVKISLDNLHEIFEKCYDNQEVNLTHIGVSLRSIDSKLTSMIHTAPSIFICIFNKSDYDFFYLNRHFNEWDRGWGRKLLTESRLKMIGSSEIFFCAEITDDLNTYEEKALVFNDQIDPSRKTFQSQIYNQFIFTLHSE